MEERLTPHKRCYSGAYSDAGSFLQLLIIRAGIKRRDGFRTCRREASVYFFRCRAGPAIQSRFTVWLLFPTTPSLTSTHAGTHCSRLPGDRWTRRKHSHPVSSRDISNTVSHHHMQALYGRLRRRRERSHNTALYLESVSLMNSPGNRALVAAGEKFHPAASFCVSICFRTITNNWIDLAASESERNLTLTRCGCRQGTVCPTGLEKVWKSVFMAVLRQIAVSPKVLPKSTGNLPKVCDAIIPVKTQLAGWENFRC